MGKTEFSSIDENRTNYLIGKKSDSSDVRASERVIRGSCAWHSVLALLLQGPMSPRKCFYVREVTNILGLVYGFRPIKK